MASPGTREVNLMAMLAPHFVSVVKIHQLIGSLRTVKDAAVSAMDALEKALIAVDGSGQVVLTNRHAQEILRRADGIFLSGKCLSAKSPSEARALAALIRVASATG